MVVCLLFSLSLHPHTIPYLDHYHFYRQYSWVWERYGSPPGTEFACHITSPHFSLCGQPSDNAAAVIAATRQLTSTFLLSRQKVTVSTVAPTPAAFATFALAPCVLAWSVHAALDARRRQLVPTTRYAMTELRQGLIEALLMRPYHFRTTMLEVALMEEVNDTRQDAEDMAVFVRGLVDQVPGCKCMVNLIPYNEISTHLPPIPKVAYRTPHQERVLAYQQCLWSHGIYTHVRVTRGDAAQAACGQLVTARRPLQRTGAL
jgi:23S rRNA (adenine2503-C2)-methyltransferase